MNTQKNKTIFSIIFSLIIIINLTFAVAQGNNYQFNFYDINSNTQITNVEGLFYQCQVPGCADNIEPQRFSTKNSGATNLISQEYLGTSNPQDYLGVFLASCELPLGGVTTGDWGYGNTYSYSAYFSKAQNCHSPIYSFNVINTVHENEPLTINVEAALDATTASAFRKTGFPPLFTPSGYESYFSADTKITLTIYDSNNNAINTQTQTISLLPDTTRQLSFTWTSTIAGDYTATITTDVTDCQCESQIQEHVTKSFTVLQNRPLGQCYTLLNSLQSNIIFPFVNDNIQLSVNDLSNHADGTGVLTPISSTLSWTITKVSTGAVVYSTTTNAGPSNTNSQYITSSTNFIPTEEGQYLVSVTGSPNSQICNGLVSTPETQAMTLTISKQPLVCTDVDNDGYSQEGGDCGQKDCVDTNANIHPNALEICNGVDDNCNGQIDESLTITCSNNNQCNDNNPLTTDICQNAGTCSSSCTHTTNQCVAGTTETQTCGTSNVGACVLGTQIRTCDVTGNWGSFGACVGAINPVAEICNGIDDNCDGLIDNGITCLVCTDNDNDGYSTQGGSCGPIDCVDTNANIHPNALEICNGIDDNCNSQIDESLTITCSNNTQCDDGIAITSDICQNAATCNSQCVHNIIQCVPGDVDAQDCGTSNIGACTLGIQTRTCDSNGNWGSFGVCVGAINPVAEICNGIDDNCDGSVDNGITCNLAPVADFTYTPNTPVTGELVFFDASLSYDPEGQPLTYSWDFENDGIIDATDVYPIYAFNTAGDHTVVLAVNDGTLTSTVQKTITVKLDQNVSFEIIASPQKGEAPLQVFFSANIFTGDAAFFYVWDFGDGHISFEENPKYIFYGEKLHPVTLTIYDQDGDSATQTIYIDTKKEHSLDSRDALYIGDATPLNEVLKKGEPLVMTVSFENRADETLNDATFQISIPELGLITDTRIGKVSDGKKISKTVTLEIPKNIASGHYYVRTTFSANSGEVRRTIYREIIIK